MTIYSETLKVRINTLAYMCIGDSVQMDGKQCKSGDNIFKPEKYMQIFGDTCGDPGQSRCAFQL